MKKKIGIDLDDVIAGCTEKVVDFHNDRYGTKSKYEDVTAWSFALWNKSKEEIFKLIMDFFDSEYYQQVEPVVGSTHAVKTLKDDYDLFIVTSRPIRLKNHTNEWLQKHFPDSFKDIYYAGNHLGDKKESKIDLIQRIGADLLIDDALIYIEECSKANMPTLLFDRPWNQTDSLPTNSKRVMNWEDIMEQLR